MTTIRKGVLPSIVALFVAYVVAHSPMVGVLGRMLHLPARRCYFTCSGWIAGGQPWTMAAALVLLGVGVFAAAVVTRANVRAYERPLAFGLGLLGFTVVPSAAIGGVAWMTGSTLLRPPLGPLLAAIPGLAFLGVAVARGWRPNIAAVPPISLRGLDAALGALALVLLVISAAIALAHPPTGYDALSYHGPMAVYFWRDGNIGALLDRTPWAWALAHPGTAELWFGLLRLAGGERAANLGQLPFALLGGAAVYAFARRTGLGARASRAGAFAFLMAPIVVVQAGVQVNDLTAGALLMVAAALLAAPAPEWSATRFFAVGIALGLTVTTKLAALPAVVVGGIFALGVAWQRRRVGPGGVGTSLALLLSGVAIVAAPWWVRNGMMFGNPIYPAALPLVGRGYVVGDFVKKDNWFVPSARTWPLYPLIEPHNEMSGYGALFAVVALVGIVVAVTVVVGRRRRVLALYGVLAAVSVLAWWILSQHEPRLLLGIFGLGFAFVGWTLFGLPRPWRATGAAIVVVAAIFSASVTIDQALRPLAQEPNGRVEFYDRVWNIDSVAADMPESESLLYHTGFAPLSYAGDYALLGPSLGRRLVVVDGPMPTDSIVGLMRRAHIRAAYVPVAEESDTAIRAMYRPSRFELEHQSLVTAGKQRGARRYLFRLRDP